MRAWSAPREVHGHGVGLGVADGVVQRLLHDAQDLTGAGGLDGGRLAVGIDAHLSLRGRAGASWPPCAARPPGRRARARRAAARRSASAARASASRASSRTRSSCGRASSGSRSSRVAAASAARLRLNSFWLTTSCSSRASRLRSDRIDSSRLRSYSRALVMAMAACDGEQLDQLAVMLVEGRRRLLLGEVEGADHPLGGDDRHAEEGAHVRMRARPPAAKPRVVVDVVGQIGAVGLEHRARASRACAAAGPWTR